MARIWASRVNRPNRPGSPAKASGRIQRDLTVELRVGGLPDLAHAPLAEEGGDIVVAEAGAGGQGHDLLGTRTAPFYAHAVNGSTNPAQKCPDKGGRGVLRGSVVPNGSEGGRRTGESCAP